MDATFDLRQLGMALATRQAASTLAERFRAASSGLGSNDSLWIDFSCVEAVSPSFADEMASGLNALLQERPAKCSFGVIGVKPPIWRTIDAVFARRGLQLRYADSAAAVQAGSLGLIGSLSASRVAV